MAPTIDILSHYNYWIAILLMMVGFYIMIVSGNLVKKLMGMVIFQTSVLLFYISIGKVTDGMAPILREMENPNPDLYSNPLPHVLMLTAIVVGVATLAVGLAIAVRIKEAYGTTEEADIIRIDREDKQQP